MEAIITKQDFITISANEEGEIVFSLNEKAVGETDFDFISSQMALLPKLDWSLHVQKALQNGLLSGISASEADCLFKAIRKMVRANKNVFANGTYEKARDAYDMIFLRERHPCAFARIPRNRFEEVAGY